MPPRDAAHEMTLIAGAVWLLERREDLLHPQRPSGGGACDDPHRRGITPADQGVRTRRALRQPADRPRQGQRAGGLRGRTWLPYLPRRRRL